MTSQISQRTALFPLVVQIPTHSQTFVNQTFFFFFFFSHIPFIAQQSLELWKSSTLGHVRALLWCA